MPDVVPILARCRDFPTLSRNAPLPLELVIGATVEVARFGQFDDCGGGPRRITTGICDLGERSQCAATITIEAVSAAIGFPANAVVITAPVIVAATPIAVSSPVSLLVPLNDRMFTAWWYGVTCLRP